jgi:hypothetical protein
LLRLLSPVAEFSNGFFAGWWTHDASLDRLFGQAQFLLCADERTDWRTGWVDIRVGGFHTGLVNPQILSGCLRRGGVGWVTHGGSTRVA